MASKPGEVEVLGGDIPLEVQGGPVAKYAGDTRIVQDPIQHFKQIASLSNQIQRAAILETKPQDWLLMGDKVYLQAPGGERVQKLPQLHMEQVAFETENFPDGTFAVVCTGRMASKLFGCVIDVVGARWSGDEYFDKFTEQKPDGWMKLGKTEQLEWRMQHRLPVDPTDVKKAAHTNWRIRGISMICGLRNLTMDDLKAAGLDVSRVKGFKYDSGGKGGKARSAMAPEKFGPADARGKPISEISDDAIKWYIMQANKNLQDSSKTQYHAKENAWLETLMVEQDTRRMDRESKAAGTATPAPPVDPDGHYPG